MTVPYAFANLSGNIALAKLDSNFNTPITIGNTSVLLGNTVTTLNNLTLANVTITSGTGANISLTSPLAVSSGGTGIANLTVNNVLIGNGTNAITSVAPGTTGNVLTSIGGAWVSNVAVTSAAAGANTQVQYNSANLLAGSANLTFDGTNLGLAGGTANGVAYLNGSKVLTTGSALTYNGSIFGVGSGATGGYGALQVRGGFAYVNEDGANTKQLYLRSDFGGNGPAIQVGGTDPLLFVLNAAEQMRLTSTGLGIGTTSPAGKLSVVGGRTFLTTAGTDPYVLNLRNPTYTNGVYLGNPGENTLGFYDNSGTERMRLDASGNLLVGTTTTGLTPASGFGFNSSQYLSIGHANGVGTGTEYLSFAYNSTKIGSITQSGTTAVLYNVTSDQRLKENIVDAPEFGSVIDSLQVRSFDWKSDGNHQRAGFVAQELVSVAPEAVHQPADPEDMMAVDYSKLVPMLVKEIQSLRTRIAQLETK